VVVTIVVLLPVFSLIAAFYVSVLSVCAPISDRRLGSDNWTYGPSKFFEQAFFALGHPWRDDTKAPMAKTFAIASTLPRRVRRRTLDRKPGLGEEGA